MNDTNDSGFSNPMAQLEALETPEPGHARETALADVVTAATSPSPVSINREYHSMTEGERDAKDRAMAAEMIESLCVPCAESDDIGPITDVDVVYLDVTTETDTTDGTEKVDGSDTIPRAPERAATMIEDEFGVRSPCYDGSDEIVEDGGPTAENAVAMTTAVITAAMANPELGRVQRPSVPAVADPFAGDGFGPIARLLVEIEAQELATKTSGPADVADGGGPAVAPGTDTTDEADSIATAKPSPVSVTSGEAGSPALAEAMEVDLPERTDDGRPIIKMRQGHLQEVMRAAECCLASTGRHFQRSGAVVTVYTDPATGESVVQDLHTLGLVHALDGVSAWSRLDKRNNVWGQIDPPERIGKHLMGAGQFQHLPVLNGLVRQPFLRPDGSMCKTPGFDTATGLFGVFAAGEFNVPAEPTWEQAQQALAVLDDLLSEFAFASPSDRSAALSAMLTAAVRTSLPLAPMFHVRAPQIASGKSYLCELITALATPQQGTPVGFPVRDEECTKLLLAQLVRAPAVIEFDNLTGDLKPFKSLCSALTSERMEGRILGRSKMTTVSTRALFLSSGNNVGPVADMTRRVVTINLDPGCEIPATREFARPNLIEDVRRERGRYVAAALTIVQAWIVAGRPKTSCPSLANYGSWSELCRLPLLWLGLPDPAASVFVGLAEDPDQELLGRLLQGWHELFGSAPIMVRDLVSRSAIGSPAAVEFTEVLRDLSDNHDRINHRKLGHCIKRYAGRVVNGLRLAKAPKTRNAENWRVESVVSVESVPVVPTVEAEAVPALAVSTELAA